MMVHIHPEIECVIADDKRTYLTNLHALSAKDINFSSPKNNGCVFRQ